MRYCVITGTTKIIDGSENSDEVMLKNAENLGYADIEILTEEEYAERKDQEPPDTTAEIARLKKLLSDTDYAIIKIAEGVATADEYVDVIAQRQAWRAEINQLELSVD